jgi:hypothetical protein
VADFTEETSFASVAWPVPIKTLQLGEAGRPIGFFAAAVAALLDVLCSARPVPIAAVQCGPLSAYADDEDRRAAIRAARSMFMWIAPG